MLLLTSNGKAQNGLHFDGVNDYVQTTYSGISGSSARTVEAWIKCPLNSTQKVIVDWGSMTIGQRFTLNLIGGKARIEVGGNGVTGTTVVADNNWHHIAVTFDNSRTSKFSLYVDGALESSFNLTVSTNTSSTGNLRIGSRVDGVNRFIGTIDEVRVYNYAKTLAQVVADTGRELCVPQTGLMAYYQLNSGTAGGTNTTVTTAIDSSGSSNNGTLTGFSLTGTTSNWVTGNSLVSCYPRCYGPTQTLVECEGFSVTVNGHTYSTTGLYSDTLVGVGCDSIIFTDLTINPIVSDTQTLVLCSGSSVTVGSNTYSNTGVYTDTLAAASSAGCDSIVTTDLTIVTFKTTNQTFVECTGFTVVVGSNTYATTGVYHDTLVGGSVGGCDSIIHTNLTILNHSSYTDVIVACYSYIWIDGVNYVNSNNTATHTLINAAGCDSVVTLNLTINTATSSTDVQSACDSYTWINNMTYNSSNTTATHTLTNAAGCDSVVTLNLTITNSTYFTDTQVACNSYVWIDGNTYTASNTTAKDTVPNSIGCDSIITLDLTITYTDATVDTLVACDSLTWVDGILYTSNNTTATHTLQNVGGCDSVVTLNLTIINSNTGTDTQVACDSLVWIDGVTYTANNNSATHHLTNSAGCDSLVTLDLTIIHGSSSTDTHTACDRFTWIDGNTYTSSNTTATYTVVNTAGCDSVVTLNLTIIKVDKTTTTAGAKITSNQAGVPTNGLIAVMDLRIFQEPQKEAILH